jgi:hypothetical protein
MSKTIFKKLKKVEKTSIQKPKSGICGYFGDFGLFWSAKSNFTCKQPLWANKKAELNQPGHDLCYVHFDSKIL